VWKLDRFARNRYDSAIHKAALKKHGVKVLSAKENISDQPEGILLEGMLESLAEYYSANLAVHVKRGQRESLLKGSHIGSVPFGFKSVKVGDIYRLIADEKKAPIIKYVFEQYAKGVSKKQIIEELNEKGLRTTTGKALTGSSMQTALRNPKYMGKYVWGGQEVPGACDALISEELFNAVQIRLDAVKHAPGRAKARQEYLLQGKAYCGHCGTRLVGESGTGKRGGFFYYYACGKKKKHHTCDKKNEKKAFLEQYVVEQTLEYVLTPQRMEYIAKRIVAKYADEFSNKKIVALERTLKKLDKEANEAVDASLEAPKAVRPKYYEKIELLELQKKDIEHDITTMRIANAHEYTEEEIIAWLKSFCKGELQDEAFQRRIIDVLVNSIYVYDNKIVIYYNIRSGKQVTYMDMCDNLENSEATSPCNSAGFGEVKGFGFQTNHPRQPQQQLVDMIVLYAVIYSTE
jgi:hypothetical protein